MIGLTDRFKFFLAPLVRCVQLMLGRCLLKVLIDKNPSQVVQVTMFCGEVRDEVERLQDYGFSSNPKEGAQGLVGFIGGDRAHGVVIKMDDRRFRPVNKDPGDVMLYTDANKKDGADTEHHIFLQSATRLISERGKTIILDADEMIELRTAGGKNFIRIGPEDYGIRMTVNGGYANGGSDIRMKYGQIWRYSAEKYISRTPVNRIELPPTQSAETGEPTMPE